jgi:hypothetical protein
MADSSAIDAALVTKLIADPTVAAFATDGVYFDVARPNAKQFVIVSLLDEADEQRFGGRAFEVATYLVKAVALSTTGANVRTAAAAIDALLDGGTMTVTGYSIVNMERTERIRLREPNESDASLYWNHRGGHYEVMASL